MAKCVHSHMYRAYQCMKDKSKIANMIEIDIDDAERRVLVRIPQEDGHEDGIDVDMPPGRGNTHQSYVALDSLDTRLRVTSKSNDEIVFGLRTETEVDSVEVNVGTLCGLVQWLACSKNKLWWMTPEWGGEYTSGIPQETQVRVMS